MTKPIPIEEFGKDPDRIIKKVEKGKKVSVTDGKVTVVLVSSDDDDFYRTFSDHNDGP